MPNNAVTYNQIVNRFRYFADAHQLINGRFFHVRVNEADMQKAEGSPFMIVTPTAINRENGQVIVYSFEVRIMQLPKHDGDNEEYEVEVLSDTAQMVEDLLAAIKYGYVFGDNVTVRDGSSSAVDWIDKHQNVGWSVTLSIEVPKNLDACDIPGDFDFVTGGTASSGSGASPFMLKSVYDADDDGIVDYAAAIEGIDSAGNSKYYGTNALGVAGFYSFPSVTIADGNKGDITVANSGAQWTINDGAVDTDKMAHNSVDNTKLTHMAQNTIKGRVTASTGDPEDLTANQASAILDGATDPFLRTSKRGANNGVASLDSGGKVPTSQLPDSVLGQVEYQGTWNAATNSPAIPAASSSNKGYYYVASSAVLSSHGYANVPAVDFEIGDWIISNGTSWEKVDNTDAVLLVNGQKGNVVLDTDDISEGATNKYNVTHTGEVTGSDALTLHKTAISNRTEVQAQPTDIILYGDTSDNNELKKDDIESILNLKNEEALIVNNLLGGVNKCFPLRSSPLEITTNLSLANQVARYIPVYITRDMTLTGAKVYIITQGNYTGNNYNGIGLYKSDGAGGMDLVASSTNDSEIWKGTSGTWITKAFSSTYAASKGMYWIALLYCQSAQTTAPIIGACPSSLAVANQTFDHTNSYKLWASRNTQTSFAASTAHSALTGTINRPFAALY